MHQTKPRRRGLAFFLTAILVFCTIAEPVVPGIISVLPIGTHISISDIHPETGLAYIGKLSDATLSDHERPVQASLYLIERRPGTFLDRLPSSLGKSFVFSWFRTLLEARFPHSSYEVASALGPGASLHQDVRDKGLGRFSIWHGLIYFSLPENTALVSVEKLDLVVHGFFGRDPETIAQIGRNTLLAIGFIAAVMIVAVAFAPAIAVGFWRNPIAHNVIPAVATTMLVLLLTFAVAECYFRMLGMFPKRQIVWPSYFVENLGMTFAPNATVKFTNGLDFWTTDRTNSLGFLDREPVLPKPQGTYRIVLIGDSFVEAVQVTLEQKVQTLLSRSLASLMRDRKSDVVAMGYSGTGQANQLPFYEKYRSDLKPDIVILLFVDNDFSNNSPVLESLRYGWDQNHLPRLFMRKIEGGRCERMPISSDWQKYSLPGKSITERVQVLRSGSSQYEAAFAGWDPAKDFVDEVFSYPTKLPPAFEEAVDLTKCSIAEWKLLAERDHFVLILVAAENVTTREPVSVPENRGKINRLKAITAELGVPFLDLYPEFVRRGNPADARWKYDQHWNPVGHMWAADAILQFLKAKSYLPGAKD